MKYLCCKDVAKIIEKNPRTVWRWVAKGILPCPDYKQGVLLGWEKRKLFRALAEIDPVRPTTH
jgi:hypothetical protein